MDTVRKKLEESLNEQLLKITISNPRKAEEIKRYSVRPVLLKGRLLFQVERYTKTQVFHENLDKEQVMRELEDILPLYKQVQIQTMTEEVTALINKKGKAAVRSKKKQTTRIRPKGAGSAVEPAAVSGWEGAPDLSRLQHNRAKHYILEEGKPVPFLRDLGVMTAEGKIVHARYDKFRQINRFLEFIEDILPRLERGRELTILDFGCGKSYLTFAMYYYLHELKGYDIRIIGLDLKREVIIHCNELAEKYGYQKLKFLVGDISDYTGVDRVDMVVTLHACDTATDFALAKAVGWNAKVILSVPCCQHELNRQIQSDVLAPVLKYGLIRERMAALVTDALRAEYLEREGYDVQILEFIDMEHTPKNILIRAVQNGKCGENQESIKKCEEFLHVSPTLKRLLDHKGEV